MFKNMSNVEELLNQIDELIADRINLNRDIERKQTANAALQIVFNELYIELNLLKKEKVFFCV